MELAFTQQFGKQTIAFYPKVQVRNSCILLYLQSDTPPKTINRHSLKDEKTYCGGVRPGTQKRIKKALDIFLQNTPTTRIYNPISNTTHDFRLSFTTLTIAEQKVITAEKAYNELLAKWLRYFKSKAGMKSYMWKAEFQERGQIHYHVLTNTFLPWQTIRWQWNSLQKKAGLLDTFAKKHKHFNPNSTDIHSVWKMNNVEAYISKYMSKDYQNTTKTKGKIWDCSTDLKKERFSTDLDRTTLENLQYGCSDGQVKELKLQHCTIYKLDSPKSILSSQIEKQYAAWL